MTGILKTTLYAIVVLAITSWLSSCGESCTYEFGNICLINGKRYTVELAISFTEDALKEIGYKSSLKRAILREGLLIEYVPWYSPRLCNIEEDSTCVIGYYKDSQIVVSDIDTCVAPVYLSHELLHFYAEKVLRSPKFQNVTHLVPGLFTEWAYYHYLDSDTVAEAQVIEMMFLYCKIIGSKKKSIFRGDRNVQILQEKALQTFQQGKQVFQKDSLSILQKED